jgi:hypothetical protein
MSLSSCSKGQHGYGFAASRAAISSKIVGRSSGSPSKHGACRDLLDRADHHLAAGWLGPIAR